MVGLAGPAGTTFRLGYGATPTLGMSYTWWEGGTGWATALFSTALDYEMVGNNDFDIHCKSWFWILRKFLITINGRYFSRL